MCTSLQNWWRAESYTIIWRSKAVLKRRKQPQSWNNLSKPSTTCTSRTLFIEISSQKTSSYLATKMKTEIWQSNLLTLASRPLSKKVMTCRVPSEVPYIWLLKSPRKSLTMRRSTFGESESLLTLSSLVSLRSKEQMKKSRMQLSIRSLSLVEWSLNSLLRQSNSQQSASTNIQTWDHRLSNYWNIRGFKTTRMKMSLMRRLHQTLHMI